MKASKPEEFVIRSPITGTRYWVSGIKNDHTGYETARAAEEMIRHRRLHAVLGSWTSVWDNSGRLSLTDLVVDYWEEIQHIMKHRRAVEKIMASKVKTEDGKPPC